MSLKADYTARLTRPSRYLVFADTADRDAWQEDLRAYQERHRARTGVTPDYWPHVRGVLGIIEPAWGGTGFHVRAIRKDCRGLQRPQVGSNDRRRPGTECRTITDAMLLLRDHLLERGDFTEQELFPITTKGAA